MTIRFCGFSTIEKTWNTIKSELEVMAESHREAGSSFQKLSEEFKRFTEVQNVKKKQVKLFPTS